MWNRDRSLETQAIPVERNMKAMLLPLFIFTVLLAWLPLKAQSGEEYQYLTKYSLPDTAVALSETQLVAGQRIYRGEPFSGLAYERYPNRKLARVQSFKAGLADGQNYVWYPGGEPQMYVNYKAGRLNGRFLGWYMHGGIIYDMVINDNGYAGDYIDQDGQGYDAGVEDTEREGTDND